MKYLATLSFLIFIGNTLLGQTFEALDHHSLSNLTVKSIPYQSGLILIQSELDDTHINYLNEEDEIIHIYTILGGEYFNINPGGITSKIDDTGNITIYLSNLWEWDFLTDIIYIINFDGEHSQVTQRRPYNSPSDLIIVDSSLYVLTHWDGLFKYDDEVEELLIEDFKFKRFYKKESGEVFCFNEDSLVSLDLSFKLSFDSINVVYDIIEDDMGANIVLGFEKIEKYSSNFSQKLWSFDYPEGFQSVRSISKNVNDIYIGLKDANNKHSIWEVNDNGVNLYYESTNDNSNLHDVLFIDSTQFLIGFFCSGASSNSMINKQILGQPIQEDYDFIDIELKDIYVEQGDRIGLDCRDSTFIHEVVFTVKNNSADTIKHFNLFLDYYQCLGFSIFYINVEFEVDTILLPEQEMTFTRSKSWKNFTGDLKFIIPGANYKRDSEFSNNVKEVAVVVNMNRELNTESIQVFPNPVEDLLNIGTIDDRLTFFDIYNLNGQQVMTGVLNTSFINVEHLKKGMYVVRLIGKPDAFYQSKFIKL